MEGGDDLVIRRWEDLHADILLNIFGLFYVFELALRILPVCKSWRSAASNPILWETLDLSAVKYCFVKVMVKPYVHVHSQSDKNLTSLLKIAVSLSHGNIRNLVFHYDLYLDDEQLACVAQRSPLVRRLVMPSWNRIELTTMCSAIRGWPELESMTMPGIDQPACVMQEISVSCRNFSQLKITGEFDTIFASSLIAYLPSLKVLSLQFSEVYKDALIHVLDDLPGLEILNITHCVLLEVRPPPLRMKFARHADPIILSKASRIREFLYCDNYFCGMCVRARRGGCVMKDGLWKSDAVGWLELEVGNSCLPLSSVEDLSSRSFQLH